jgi:uncharacterized protein YjbI with pentapeptide repeats
MTQIHDEDWDAVAGQTRHQEVTLVDVDLCEATLSGVEFDHCAFRNVRFNCAVLTDVAFTNCTFTACTFFDARLTRCKLVGSTFDRCTFELLEVDGGDWSFTELPQAVLGSATFKGVRMREVDLTGAKCQGSVLRDVDLSGARLRGADFTSCDLRGSDLSALEPESMELARAIITADQAVTVAITLGLDVRPA